MTMPPAGDHAVRLPFESGAARVARDLVNDLLDAHGVTDELRQDAALVVHELVVNAILHGRPDEQQRIEFSTWVDAGQLVISVLDQGHGGRVAVKPPSQDAPNGRGLAIVEALSASWTVDRTHGTRVSAHLVL